VKKGENGARHHFPRRRCHALTGEAGKSYSTNPVEYVQSIFRHPKTFRPPTRRGLPSADTIPLPQFQAGGAQVNPTVRNLVALQDVELKIASFQKQISGVPLKIQSFQTELNRLKQEHEREVARSQELAKQRRALEGGVEMLRTKLSKLKDQQSAVKTNKEYTAILHEIQMAEEQIRNEEDKILDIMEENEQLEKALKAAERDLNAKCVALQQDIRKHETSVPDLEAEVAKAQQTRREMEAGIEVDLLERYRKIADARKGVALAEAKEELCTLCHVRIRPQVYADLKQTEEIHTCDSCSRILFLRESL
jgi:predicted  nucleic acid-binding Zn-ribbon protein